MAVYSSKPVTVARSAEELANKFSDFSVLQDALDKMDPERRAAVGDVSFTTDTIVINTPQVGAICLRAIERSPQGITLQAEGSPVEMKMNVSFKPVSEDSTEVQGAIEVQIPAILKAMVGPTLQKAADRFGELFAGLA